MFGFEHLWCHRLDREEVVTQVRVETVVPIFGSDVFPRVAVVVRSIVDEGLNAPEVGNDLSNRFLGGRNIEKVDLSKYRRVRSAECNTSSNHVGCLIGLNVEERNPASLLCKLLDKPGANTIGSAGDEHRPID